MSLPCETPWRKDKKKRRERGRRGEVVFERRWCLIEPIRQESIKKRGADAWRGCVEGGAGGRFVWRTGG
jgi:hypothetical protein